MRPHGILEDICAEIGYEATKALVVWFGGTKLWIPPVADAEHPIARVIGLPALRRLVTWHKGRHNDERRLWIPFDDRHEVTRRDRRIAEMIADGKGSAEISATTGLSPRNIQYVRVRLVNMGVLPLLVRRGAPEKPGVSRRGRPVKKPGVSAGGMASEKDC